MEEKSYVGMGFHVCPVCGIKHTEEVLIDKRMIATLTTNMFLGYMMCLEDKKRFDEGYIAFIECENSGVADKLKQEEAVRTGRIFHIRKEAIDKIFNYPTIEHPFVFCEKEVGDMLTNLGTTSEDTSVPDSSLH